jgi:hypothetical protein
MILVFFDVLREFIGEKYDIFGANNKDLMKNNGFAIIF